MINLFLNNFAALVGSQFLSLNARNPELFSYQNLHWIVASVCFITTIIVIFGMKEVIVRKDSKEEDPEQNNLVDRPNLKTIFQKSF
jgi:Na+/melibiose symporter-like transporter